jgi:DNA-binding CsgD family transcriptional regulator/tetratricopeptide (TPR) repeat protein
MDPDLEQLNPREIEILTLIADGLSNREIGLKLSLSLETVKWYNKLAFAKLGAASRTQAVSIAKNRGLLAAQSSAPSPARIARQSEPTGAVRLLNQLARGRMVGRLGELTQLQGLWTRAQQGLVHLALVSGEPGIGKTRLANELLVYAQQNGAVLLHGGCYEYEATTPYLPFVEAFREWVHLQPADTIQRRMGDTAGELARLAPEIEAKLGPLAPNSALPASEERLRLFDHVTRFLQNLAGDSGLLLFIDDLHWADQGTLSLLSYVLRNLHTEKILILAAYREIELDRKHPLAAALVEWNRERITTRISLARLTFEETSSLLAVLFGQETISDDLTRVLYMETEGNPFFIEEVVKALIEQGQIFQEDGRWERKEISELAIPQSVKEAIGRRLNRLSETCLDALHAAAALGKEFDFPELVAVSSMSEDRLLDALDEGAAAQLIQPKNRETFSFTHDKIREVLYEEINPIRRKRLHQHIGETLERQLQSGNQAYIQDLAHHFTESGDLARSLKYSILAAEKASRLFALDDALGYYETALEAAESLAQTGQVAAIHKAIGEMHSQRGQLNQSVESFQQAIDLENDSEMRGAIKAQLGSVYASAGDARGLAVIEEALLELNPDTQADEVALATAMIGRYYHYRCFHWKAIEYLERARLIAEPLDHAETVGQIYAYLAGAYQHMTRFKESMTWARKNIELGQRKNNLIIEAYGYEFLAEDSYAVGEWGLTLEYAARDLEIGKKIGAQDRIGWAGYCQAAARHGLGDLAAAGELAQSTRLLAENIGDIRLAILSGALMVQILADLGKAEEAHRLGEQTLGDADEIGHVNIRVIARYSLAYSLLQYHQIERALALYVESEQLIEPTENRWMAMNYRPWLAQVYLDTGRAEQAAGMVDKALDLARNAGSRFHEALALRVRAQLFAASNRWEEAITAIQNSIAMLDQSHSRLELGRSIFIRGKIFHQQGNLPAAMDDLARCLELFSGLGALTSIEKTREQLKMVSNTPV